MRISAVSCGSALLLAPLAGRSSIQPNGARGRTEVRIHAPILPSATAPAPVEVTRDPFESNVSLESASQDVVGISPLTFTLPPNAGASGVPLRGVPEYGAATLRAIVTGASPRALVEDAGTVRVIAVGDDLAGSQVVSITVGGVRLQNGVVYHLQPPTGRADER